MRSCGWKKSELSGTGARTCAPTTGVIQIHKNCCKISELTDINLHQDYRKDEHLCGSSKLMSIKVEQKEPVLA